MSLSEDANRLSEGAVRQPQEVLPGTDAPKATKRPADRSKPVLAVLNDRWRVIDDGIQWVLQKRKGRPTPKSSGWRGRSYATSRASLLDCIERLCGSVDPAALRVIEGLPADHPKLGKGAPSPLMLPLRGKARGRHGVPSVTAVLVEKWNYAATEGDEMKKTECDAAAAEAADQLRLERREALSIAMTDAIKKAIAANNEIEISQGGQTYAPAEVFSALARTVRDIVGFDRIDAFGERLYTVDVED